MAFEDLRENLQSELKNQWEKFQESSLYIQIKERYENLTPVMQKLTLAGLSLILIYTVLSFPLGFFSQSSQSVSEFEDRRQLLRDLLKSSKEAQESPDFSVPPPMESFKSQVEGEIKAARLLPEQVLDVSLAGNNLQLIPEQLSQGILQIHLGKLNLRQILDLGYKFQSLSPSVKMMDLSMEANEQDHRYYDVTYRMAMLAVPEKIEVAPEPEPSAKKRGK